jgi:hypothetical protein
MGGSEARAKSSFERRRSSARCGSWQGRFKGSHRERVREQETTAAGNALREEVPEEVRP